MAQDEHEMLELLRFELKFLENGGYGRSPRTPWRPPFIFEDSPSCLNLGDHWAASRAAVRTRMHSCSECLLMKFVPEELQNENSSCRFIPLNEKGETIDYFYRCGTQLELEEALAGWLRKQVSRLEEQRKATTEAQHSSGIDPLRRRQWLGLAGNLYSLANFYREDHNYVVAHSLYGRALAAAEKVATLEDNGRSLVARIRKDQQAVSEILNGEKGALNKFPRKDYSRKSCRWWVNSFMTQQKNEIAANERKGSKSAQFSKRRTSSGLGSCAVLSADFHLRGSNYMPEHSFGCDAGHKGS